MGLGSPFPNGIYKADMKLTDDTDDNIARIVLWAEVKVHFETSLF